MNIDTTQPLPEKHKPYWAHPEPFKDTSADTPESIYHAMGAALVVFEGTESIVPMLFAHFLEVQYANAATRAFGAVASSEDRIRMLDAAAEVYFHRHKVSERLQSVFYRICNHYQEARQKRNDIAHAIVMDFQFGGGSDAAGVFLIPATYSSRKNEPFRKLGAHRLEAIGSKYRLTSEDIDLFRQKFVHLQQAVMRFHSDFAKEHPPGPFPSYPPKA